MSETPDILEPYSAPRPEQPPVAPTGLSTGLKTIAIIGIVLGAFGLLSAAMGVVGMALNDRMQTMFSAPPSTAGDQNMLKTQQELQQRIAESLQRFQTAMIGRIVFQFIVATLLLVGGIMVLLAKSRGRAIFRTGCALAIPYQLVAVTLNVIVQVNNMQIMRDFSGRMFGAGQEGQATPQMMSNVMTAAMYVGLIIAFAFALVKLVYYVIAVVYLGKASVRAQFQK